MGRDISSRPQNKSAAAASFMAALFGLCLWLAPLPASAASLNLELNKTENGAQGCVATMLIANDLGGTLNQFRLDLVLFNGKGVLFDRLLIDLSPVPANRTTIARFALHAGRCEDISRIILRDVPVCQVREQSNIDCLSGLGFTNRTGIEFGK